MLEIVLFFWSKLQSDRRSNPKRKLFYDIFFTNAIKYTSYQICQIGILAGTNFFFRVMPNPSKPDKIIIIFRSLKRLLLNNTSFILL